MQLPKCYPKCAANSFGLGPICWLNCPADTTQCMGVFCLKNGLKCSTEFAAVYDQIQSVVYSLMEEQVTTGIINVGEMIDDQSPLCPAS